VLERLRRIARRIEDERHLLGNKLTTKEEECLACIKSDTASQTMDGIDRGINRLISMIDGTSSDADQSPDETSKS
jgi:CHASE3 domain sensor protein